MSELGLFPLPMVLLPTEQMPLHIFEERYKELIDECLEEDSAFGLLYAEADGIHEIGTNASVVEVLTRFEDGRMNILVEGGERFRIEELTEGRSFQTGVAVPVLDDDDPAEDETIERALELFGRLKELTGSEVEVPPAEVSAALLRSCRARRARPGGEAGASPGHLGARSAGARLRAARGRRRDRRAASTRRRASLDQRPRRPQLSDGADGDPEGRGYDASVAVTTTPTLDAKRLRADFPIFEQEIHGKPLAFLDSAASSQKPRQMLDAMNEFYETSYANVHRGVYVLAERATEGLELAREKVRALLNAPAAREVIFVRNATEGINLVSYAWGLSRLGPGDLVVVSELEHHSNFVPWQYVASRTGAGFRMISLDEQGELRLDELDAIASEGNVKVVATGVVSNSLGTVNPVERLAAWAHEQGAIMVADAAQAAPHRKVDVQAIGCRLRRDLGAQDVRAERRRRALGPRGAARGDGAVSDRRPHDPFGRRRRHDLGRAAAQVRGGHRADGGGGGLRCGDRLPDRSRLRRDRAVRARARRVRARAPRGAPLGDVVRSPADRRAGIVSFNVEGVHPHDVAQVLDFEGVAIRAGHHCCQPLMRKLGVAATNRASFYLYTIPEEIDRLVDGLHKVKKAFA